MKNFSKGRVEIKPASAVGYTLTQEEKEIIKQENKSYSKRNISKLSNDTGKYIDPNLTELPQLYISEIEHEEIVHKTVGRVVEKMDEELDK